MSAPALWSPVILLVTTLTAYHKIAFGPGVPGGYDTQTYFFAYRHAVAAALKAGQFPLWNSHIFLGAPLFANVQAAVLYLPNVIYLFLPTPQAIAASLILHVWWACWGMALLCRRTFRLSWAAATVGGAMFGLGGFMSAQSGHVNQVNTAAWLPWLLLCLDLAWQRRSARLAVLSAVVVALQFLAGHTQESYFILCVTVTWGVWRLLQQRHARLDLAAILATGVVAVGGGGALAAVQLLPTLELAGQSIRRSGLTLAEASSFSWRPDQLAQEILPGYAHQPDSTEFVAYVGALGLLFVLIGAVRGYRRPGYSLLWLFTAVPLALAFGQYDPLWTLAFHVVPGFAAFRVPARWLFVTTFGLAALGAIGLDTILEWTPRYLQLLGRAAAAILTLAFFGSAAAMALGRIGGPSGVVSALTAGGGACLLALAATTSTRRTGSSNAGRDILTAPASEAAPPFRGALHSFGLRPDLRLVLAAAAVLELVVAASWLDLNKPIPEAVYSNLRPSVAFIRGQPNAGRVLSIAQDYFSPGDTATLRQIADRTIGPAGEYRTIVEAKFQEILTPNLSLAYGLQSVDGYDGGILPLASYVALKQAFVPPCPVCGNPDAILRAELSAPPPTRWLRLLGVGTLINDRLHDFHNGGVDYDLTNTLQLAPGATTDVGPFAAAPATSVGLVTDVAGPPPAATTAVADVLLTDVAGNVTVATLTAGVDTGPLLGAAPGQPSTALRDVPGGHAYVAVVHLASPTRLAQIRVQSLLASGELQVRALNVHDDVTGGNETVTLSAGGALQRVFSGDVNIYHVHGAAAPAFLALRVEVKADDGQVTKLLQSPTFPLLQEAVLSYPDFGPRLSLATRALRRLDAMLQGDPRLLPPPPVATATSGTLQLAAHGTRLDAQVRTDGPAYVILKQAWYPGWRATVDGVRVPVYRADLALQAIPVPAGVHHVVVEYRPASVLVGAITSVVALVVLLALALFGARLSRRWSVPDRQALS